MTKAIALIIWAAVIGVAAGVLLDVATFLTARYGPQAGDWSLRGNGALIVPFGLGPAILAGVWVALVLRYRGFAKWKELGLAAGLVGLPLMVVSVGWMVVAPVLAGFIRERGQVRPRGQLASHIGAGALFAVGLIGAFYASGLVLAPGS